MADALSKIGSALGSLYNSLPSIAPKEIEKVIVKEVEMLRSPASAQYFVRLAGLSGAMAVGLGAYGAHVMSGKEVDPKLREVFDIANKYHFLHTLGLLSVPLARKPVLVGTLMTTGVVLFSGSCYVHALTGNMAVRNVTPYGGVLLIFAWLAFAL